MCTRCDSTAPKFVSVPGTGRSFHGVEWVEICEACASLEPDFYFRYIDYGGTYSPADGTREDITHDLTRLVEREGEDILKQVEVYVVPGKYRYLSDYDKRKFGRKIYVTAKIKVEVIL